ncbi:MAG TPA: nitroreductase family protein [Solirubrobacteraceae bacterium]|nr:nitroreductase family protein [Solirubrobacteraceae bacterium]
MPPDRLTEVMRGAPTSRNFTAQPVDPGALRRALDNARFAPSGGNRQGWRVIVITDRDTRRRMRELYAPHWAAYMERTGGRAVLAAGEASGLSAGRLKGIREADAFAGRFDEVPVHLVLLVALDALVITDAELDRPSVVAGASVYPFVQNLLLALRHEELGAAFTTLLVPAEPEIKTLLEIPDGFAMAGHICVGHRADAWPRRLSRRPVEEFAFGERFGAPW